MVEEHVQDKRTRKTPRTGTALRRHRKCTQGRVQSNDHKNDQRSLVKNGCTEQEVSI